jgi:hypothetical protein
MEPGGGISSVKPMDVDPKRVKLHNTNNSELSVSTASVSTLPHLEATDAERILNEEEKKEQHRLEEKKARKEERKLKREARRKRREARKKKEQEAKASKASSSELSRSFEDGYDDESYQVHSKDKKGKGKKNDDNKYAHGQVTLF